MYFDELKTFVTLVEVKNFTKTAELLLMSQPSVSLHIKNLENEFQTKLFIRSPKQLKITPSGEILYDRAKQLISMYEQTKQDILDLHSSVRGSLKIGASFTIGEYILPSLLFDIQKEHQALELEVVIGNTKEIVLSVKRHEVDIGLIEGQTNEKELSVHPFLKDELFVVSSATHPLAIMNRDIFISDLQNQLWVTREVGSGTREYLNHVIRSNGLKVKSLLSISSNQGIKETISKGMGLSLLSNSVIHKEVKNGELAILNVKDYRFPRTLSYVYSPIMKEKKNVKLFIDHLQEMWPYQSESV
ncbi:LysR family transcriptional regulator [Mycobacteroides abscessus subsp. abscessus]|nr:LysR family transcriptional regulator [Mycobacteroides abscessus subsp. abscessus]